MSGVPRPVAVMADWSAWPFSIDDPYPGYEAARARAPVIWDDGLECFLVLSYETARQVLRDPRWSSDPRNSPDLQAAIGGPGPVSEFWSKSLLMSDPPVHTRLRTAVNRFFTPRSVEAIRARVGAIVEAAFEPLADEDSIDLMEELAYPIPLAVIAELFDVGVEGARLLREDTPAMARMLDLDASPETLEAAGAAAMTLMLFLVPIVAERRRSPGSDLLSTLVRPAHDGTALETDEVIVMCLLLLAAGHETTANLIGNGALALREHPEQLEWLRTHPERTPEAVEELLRYDSPVQLASRVAACDLVLDGREVSIGQQALVVLGASNRDPERFSDPNRLDLAGQRPPHLAFGNGPHFCVGAGLARLEADEVFRRIPHASIGWDPAGWAIARDPSRTFRRLRSLRAAREQPRAAGYARFDLRG